MPSPTLRPCGRFAPSPTGPLHAGSLVAALGSYVDARAQGYTWRVRIDDVDTPRTLPGTAADVLRTLEIHGLEWDGAVVYQSARNERYAAMFQRLVAAGLVYRCRCSRRQLSQQPLHHGALGRVYPGTCRRAPPPADAPSASRLALPARRLMLQDRVHGPIALDPVDEIGDVVLRRRDGIWAYHLATTVDDADMGVTQVVRGADLLPAAFVQVALQEALGLTGPAWCHLPLVRAPAGAKLSKQTGATALDPARPLDSLLAAWGVLGQPEPPDQPDNVAEFHEWASATWDPSRIPTETAMAHIAIAS